VIRARDRHAAVVLLLAPALMVAACSIGRAASPAAAQVRLQLYAAASLKTALTDATAAYMAANPGVTFALSTDSSAALETKIEQGAPADVFLSADIGNPQRLVDGGLASGPVRPFAGNLLTVAVPAGNPASIASPAGLAKAGVKVIAAGDEVPITKYAAQLVDNLGNEQGYPADFAASYAGNIVSREDNVSAVLAKLALGEGDAGIVYVTDARAVDGIETIPVPDSANVPATYGGVVVTSSAARAEAAAFLSWLTGPAAQGVFADAGFTPAP
jgi:molybdate transport system substrate-binding protein